MGLGGPESAQPRPQYQLPPPPPPPPRQVSTTPPSPPAFRLAQKTKMNLDGPGYALTLLLLGETESNYN